MNAATGFTLLWKGLLEQQVRADTALSSVLAHFPDLKKRAIVIGDTTLVIWGRNNLDDCTHVLPDGSMMVLVGSPVGNMSWAEVESGITSTTHLEDFRLPWDGRVILLRVSADGNRWMMWNDWLGSIPVFYTIFSQWRVASTLEPVVVATNALGSEDIFLPGLLLLLSHGNYMADWTLYKEMHTICPDSVTTFGEQCYRTVPCCTIAATDGRWEVGWDDLIEEMHFLIQKAIRQTLKTQQEWIVPLSSGLDSRLIAAVGAEAGSNLRTYTWGPSTTRDGVYSHQIACALNLSWRRIALSDDYLARYLPLWVDLFGSSMHFHGMYQIPFLETLRETPPAPIISGLIGECLAGYDVHFQAVHHRSNERHYVAHPSGYIFWDTNELKSLFHISINEALEEIADKIEFEKSAVEGPWFQKLRFITLWGRQNHFTYFQSMLSDYYCGVATPYLNREYANFCMSLPRALLDGRRLQIDMMRRFYPKVMSIGGTYAPDPAILTGRYLLKRRASKMLPRALTKRLLPEFTATKNIKTDIRSLRACGNKAIWPIPETKPLLAEWINVEQVEKAYISAIEGDMRSVRKIQTIQTFAYRLNNKKSVSN